MTTATKFQLLANLDYIKENYSEQLSSLVASRADDISFSGDKESLHLYKNDYLLTANLSADISNFTLTEPRSFSTVCVALPRINNVTDCSDQDLLSDDLIDNDDEPLFSFIDSFTSAYQTTSLVKRDILLLGSLSVASLVNDLAQNINLYSEFRSITLVETDASDLASLLSIINFQEFIETLKSLNIRFHLIIANNYLQAQERTFRYITQTFLASLHGLVIVSTFQLDAPLVRLKSWLTSQSGLGYRAIASLGFATDEINQLHNASINLSTEQNNDNTFNLTDDLNASRRLPVIVGSGPSLNHHIEDLLRYRERLYIISSGSSISSLLQNGITPDAMCILERSKAIFIRLRELSELYPHLKDIPLLMSNTADRRISTIIRKIQYFSRPLSLASRLFFPDSSETDSLMGPEATNATLELVLSTLCPELVLCGCDFGSTSPSEYRSPFAMGDSPRIMNEPVLGNKKRTVYTEQMFILARDSFQYTLDKHVSNVSVYRLGEGLQLSSVIDIDDIIKISSGYPLLGDNNPQSGSIKGVLQPGLSYPHPQVILSSLQKFKENLSIYRDLLVDILTSSNSYQQKVHVSLSAYLMPTPQTCDNYKDVIAASKLYRQSLFFMIANLYNSKSVDDYERRSKNIVTNINGIHDVFARSVDTIINNLAQSDF